MQKSTTKYFSYAICLAGLLLISSCDKKTDDKVKEPFAVTVDGIIKSDTEMEYRIVLLSRSDKPVIVKRFNDIVNLIWSSEEEFAYLDQQGYVWMMALSDLSPRFLLDTGYIPHEDVSGRFILKKSEKKLFYIINSHSPSSPRMFSFNCVPFKGKRQTLFLGSGKAYAVKQISDNIFRIVTLINTVDIDITSGETTFFKNDTKGSIPAFFTPNYIVKHRYDSNRNKVLEVMGNDGNDLPVLQYTINKKSGFGLPADLDENSKGLLLIEVQH